MFKTPLYKRTLAQEYNKIKVKTRREMSAKTTRETSGPLRWRLCPNRKLHLGGPIGGPLGRLWWFPTILSTAQIKQKDDTVAAKIRILSKSNFV